jgi:integral membrane protein (TIGR00529 family)
VEREVVALAISVVVVVALLRFRVDLGITMLAAAAALALAAGRTPLWTAREMGRAAIDRETLLLLARIVAIIALGEIAGALGYFGRLVSGLRRLIPDNRIVIALMPAFGGLLPMPGGAMLTAPMVESSVPPGGASAEQKFFVNYWFRHVWEYIWPLYPGVVVGSSLVGKRVSDMFVSNWPLTLAAIAGGAFFVLRGVRAGRNERRAGEARQANRDVLMGMLPFGIVVAGVLVFKIEVALVVLAVAAFLVAVGRPSPRAVLKAFAHGAEYQVVTLIVGVAAYNHVLTGANVIDAVPALFVRLHMPPVLALCLVPMMLGLITGVTLGAIAVSFPLLLPLMGGASVDMSLVMLAFASGFVGCLLSPVHLCLVLSRQYFKADLGRSYRLLLAPCLVVMVVAVAIALV